MVLGWIKNQLAGKPPEVAPVAKQPVGPRGLQVNRVVDLDFLDFAIINDQLSMPVDAAYGLVITAHGLVELEPNVFLHRFYGEDHEFLQVVAEGKGEDATVNEITFFRSWDSVVPSPAGWAEWDGKGAKIGGKTYDADGTLFNRYWNYEEDGWVPPVEFTETVIDNDGLTKRIRQKMMVYDRSVEDKSEVLIISIEEPENASRSNRNEASIGFYLGHAVASPSVRTV